jgi:hypothetical protein
MANGSRAGLLALISLAMGGAASAQTTIRCKLDRAGVFGGFTVSFVSPQIGQVRWFAPLVPLDLVCNPQSGQRVCRGQAQNYVLELVGRRVTMRNYGTGGVIDTGSCNG